jgi:predicted permease
MFWRRRKPPERDLDRELRAHLDLEAEEQRSSGLPDDAAEHAARRALGNSTYLKEDLRAVWHWTSVERLVQDLRYAARTLRRNRTFTAAAILSLALGIGANTAIFSLFDALVLRSLPVHKPAELVQVQLVELGRPGSSFGYPSIRALAARTDIFEGLFGFTPAVFNVGSQDGYEHVPGALVTGACYETLSIAPLAGRLLSRSDDRPSAPPVAVLSYSYWEARYARDYSIIGRTITIEGKPVEVVGISPKGFNGADVGNPANITLALGAMPQLYPERATQLEAGPQWLRVIARPQTGLTIAQVKARLAVIWPEMAVSATTPRMNPKRREVLLHSTLDVISGSTGWSFFRDQFRRPLIILLVITGLVLLISCANFANLLLARGTARSKEIALRFAIGASRPRILRQLLTESVLLSTLGAALGLGLAISAGRLLVALLSASRPQGIALDLRPDARILLFTTAVALATGILFGLIPALRATANRPAIRTRSRLLSALVVSQVALSLILLIGAGLFIRTLQNLQRRDPGFRREGVLIVNIDARRAGYKDARLAAFYRDLLAAFEHFPGVQSASISAGTPLNGGVWSTPVSINGARLSRDAAVFNAVGPLYFETLETPLVFGRDFDDRDHPGIVTAAIVNESFVRRCLLGENPIGQRLGTDIAQYRSLEVVGLVRDTVSASLREPTPPAVYVPFPFDNAMIPSYELRVHGSLAQTADLIRVEIRAKLPGIPVQSQIQTLDEQVRRTLITERMLAALGTAFGALALILAAVGLYGLLAYTVARSTSEIGIRMALGARRSQVLRGILTGAFGLLALGAVLGIPAAWAASRLIASWLYGIRATDPLTIILATALLAAAAILAALKPAIRASRTDPMTALRYE